MEDDQTCDESSYSISSPFHPGGYHFLGLGESRIPVRKSRVSVSADNIFFVLAFIEMFDLTLGSYFPNPTSKFKLTNPDEVHEAIWSLKVGRAPDPNGIPNRALKHLPQ